MMTSDEDDPFSIDMKETLLKYFIWCRGQETVVLGRYPHNKMLQYAIERSSTDAFLNKYFMDAGSKFNVKYPHDPESWPAKEDKMCFYIYCAHIRSTPAWRLYSHLANEQDTTCPGQSPAQDVFF